MSATSNAVKKTEPTGSDLSLAVSENPGLVLLDTEKFDAWYEKLKADAPQNVDVSTRKGQDILRSYAAEIRSEKAAIDKARLRLTKEWRDMTSQANAAGKVIEERLEGLAVEIRKPLTEWEDAEKARIKECDDIINRISLDGVVTIEDTAATVRQRGMDVWAIKLDADRFGDKLAAAQEAKDKAVAVLKTALDRLTKEEADRAELEALRAANAEREAKEAAEREELEARERQAAAEKAEVERREAEEAAEQQRIKDAAEKAAQAARDEAARLAREEQEAQQRRHQEELAAEKKRADDAEAERKAAADKAAAEEAARTAAAKREADAKAKREADQAHKAKVYGAAKAAIMSCGVEEPVAKAIVLAIVANTIPHVRLDL